PLSRLSSSSLNTSGSPNRCEISSSRSISVIVPSKSRTSDVPPPGTLSSRSRLTRVRRSPLRSPQGRRLGTPYAREKKRQRGRPGRKSKRGSRVRSRRSCPSRGASPEPLEREPGKPVTHGRRELEAVPRTGRADDDTPVPLEHEALVGRRRVKAALG